MADRAEGRLKDNRNDYEDLCLARLAEVLPEGVAVTILADRGFGDNGFWRWVMAPWGGVRAGLA